MSEVQDFVQQVVIHEMARIEARNARPTAIVLSEEAFKGLGPMFSHLWGLPIERRPDTDFPGTAIHVRSVGA